MDDTRLVHIGHWMGNAHISADVHATGVAAQFDTYFVEALSDILVYNVRLYDGNSSNGRERH